MLVIQLLGLNHLQLQGPDFLRFGLTCRHQPWREGTLGTDRVCLYLSDCILNINIKINFNSESFVDYYYPEVSTKADKYLSVDLKYISVSSIPCSETKKKERNRETFLKLCKQTTCSKEKISHLATKRHRQRKAYARNVDRI